ncbi:MAG: hypothetical protein A2Z29_01170 [Chloroflexi bacterium RBG_16_56_11]|nr:MAG: hypothetical protein A2Z29_01170 [Chloroflexi bacterium RBG_16_56_11]
MTIYNRFAITISVVLLLTTVVMVGIGQDSLSFYFTVYFIEALAITELYVYFNSRARRGLTYVSAMLFAGFAVSLLFQVVNIFR